MNPNQPITLTLPWQTVQIISAALHEISFRVANPILADLQKQINDQVASDNVVPIKPEDQAAS